MNKIIKYILTNMVATMASILVIAQTDNDAIMMNEGSMCTGLMYQTNAWTEYWEGTMKRTAPNMGKVSTQMLGAMGNYGIKDNLNLLFSLPYIKTNASAGTLQGQRGLQDFSIWLKYMPIEIENGEHTFSVYTIAGLTVPTSNYIADYLPLSIGLQSKNLSLRGMVDYQYKNFFITASGTAVVRSNINIDRYAYYTTQQHSTNEVYMPNAAQLNLRTGYRSGNLIAELLVDNWYTTGGHDIRRNDMPFPSNNMDVKRLGINVKYTLNKPMGLSLIGGGSITYKGRNMGKASGINAGIFYILDFTRNRNVADN
jgi:hypothetical protein